MKSKPVPIEFNISETYPSLKAKVPSSRTFNIIINGQPVSLKATRDNVRFLRWFADNMEKWLKVRR